MTGHVINVIIWHEKESRAWTFKRVLVPSDPHMLRVRISGIVYPYDMCGIDISEIHKLPRDAKEITVTEANAL